MDVKPHLARLLHDELLRKCDVVARAGATHDDYPRSEVFERPGWRLEYTSGPVLQIAFESQATFATVAESAPLEVPQPETALIRPVVFCETDWGRYGLGHNVRARLFVLFELSKH